MAKASFTAVLDVIDRVTRPLKKMERQMRPFKRAFQDIGRATSGLQATITGLVAPLGAVFGAAGLGSIGALGTKVVSTSAQFERFETILTTIEGSSDKAKASMNWISQFASQTPYELAGVTDAFVKLKAYGIDPQSGALKSAGDAAAAMGKPLEQAVEALADAMTGENERLKEFGITSEKAGDKIVYRWQQNGKAMVATAKANSREQIQAVIQGIWNGNYGGAMDKLSSTWDGMWSNLQDTFTRVFKMIGDAGVFDVLKGELKGVLDSLQAMEADGSLKKFAQAVSDNLVSVFRELKSWVMAIDWQGVWDSVKGFTTGVIDVTKALGGLKGIAIIIASIIGLQVLSSVVGLTMGLLSLGVTAGPALMAVATGFKGVLLAMGPIGWILAGIGTAAALIYANWETVGPWFAAMWQGIKDVASATWDWLKDALFSFSPLGLVIKNWEPLVGWFSGLWDRVKQFIEPITGAVSKVGGWFGGDEEVAPAAATGAGGGGVAPPGAVTDAIARQRALVSGNRQSLDGQMVVKFENAPPGMQVQAARTNQPGLAMEADVGYRSLAMP
ncbi:hypothetical protein D7243_10530 [Stutzerimonas stutzeri]|nr:hypothetical protein [Stutzerimonas stutzeri]